jgi:hypothetical protein
MRWRLTYAGSDHTSGPWDALTPDALRAALAALWTGRQAGLEVHAEGAGEDWIGVGLLLPGHAPTLERCASLSRDAVTLLARRQEVLEAMRKGGPGGTFAHLRPRPE